MVLKYAHSAATHAKAVVDMIKSKLAEDNTKRSEGKVDEIGLAYAFQRQTILSNSMEESEVIKRVAGINEVKQQIVNEVEDDMDVVEVDKGVAEMIKSIRNEVEQVDLEDDDDDDESEEEVAEVNRISGQEKKVFQEVTLDSDEEEETVTIIGGSEFKK